MLVELLIEVWHGVLQLVAFDLALTQKFLCQA
jgi:hypothetical protein